MTQIKPSGKIKYRRLFMSEYKLELKQIVDYPRCRIYREFIRTLMKDRSIRVSGCSGLFYFTVLCSYANFRTSYKRIEGINYTVYPGEWICRANEIKSWFRAKSITQTTAILDNLQNQHLISYTTLGRGHIIKFRIKCWKTFNTILEYNAPCQKDTGFFFMPVSKATELISSVRCSEMDIVLDLWMQTVYNDENVQGSDVGPVVYIRNSSGSPLIGYAELAKRWGLSKATVGRILKKLKEKDYLTLVSFAGRQGSVIYLKNYLSTMFQVSDIMLDKEEIAMSLNIKLSVNETDSLQTESDLIPSEQISVSKELSCVSKSLVEIVVEKVAEILSAQGFSCGKCPKIRYMLYPLSPDCKEIYIKALTVNRQRFAFAVTCGEKKLFEFEMELKRITDQNERRNQDG